MSCASELSQSNEYLSFRSSIPLRKIVVDSDGSKAWRIFDSGPKSVSCPLICLPPVSGTADVFFQQVLGLATRGVRVIAAEPPPYWNMKEWCDGFKKLIDYLELDKVHVFGASLGGFIAQKFAELTSNCPRVASLVLCNTFTDTSVFEYHDSSALFWLLPSLVLKRMLMGNFTTDKVDKRMAESIDFMVERLESLNQAELASRLTLNCTPCYIKPQALLNLPITVMDVWDECALSSRVREDLYKSYPQAKLAHLKSGGNFPYLSRSDEVNLHLLIHLRQFDGTDLSASYLSLHKMPAPTNLTQPEEVFIIDDISIPNVASAQLAEDIYTNQPSTFNLEVPSSFENSPLMTLEELEVPHHRSTPVNSELSVPTPTVKPYKIAQPTLTLPSTVLFTNV